jgi:ribosomal protein S18 acetylase RimI-like enzyme
MRIRNFRPEDILTLVHIQQAAAQVDRSVKMSEEEFTVWFLANTVDALSNAFVITDDDDELNTWGQAGTLEGIEGEIVGYTLVQFFQDRHGYHLQSQGAVHPQHRHRNAGRALLICALNRARLVATEFEFEAEQADIPIYFEAWLPIDDPASHRLAAKCEMVPTDEQASEGMRLYRRTL